jgi:two-component system, NarL family, response regulator
LKLIRGDEEAKELPVMMLTSCDDEKSVVSGLRRGVDTYLTKPITPSRLMAHIEALSRRVEWGVKTHGDSKLPVDESIQASIKLLTQREKELLELIVKGYSNQKIGQELVISETTVKNHIAHIFKKLNVSNRTQAAFFAQKYKLF